MVELPQDEAVKQALLEATYDAVVGGHLVVLQYLCALPIDRGVHMDWHDNLLLRCASADGHLDVVKFLCALPLVRGVDPGANDNTDNVKRIGTLFFIVGEVPTPDSSTWAHIMAAEMLPHIEPHTLDAPHLVDLVVVEIAKGVGLRTGGPSRVHCVVYVCPMNKS